MGKVWPPTPGLEPGSHHRHQRRITAFISTRLRRGQNSSKNNPFFERPLVPMWRHCVEVTVKTTSSVKVVDGIVVFTSTKGFFPHTVSIKPRESLLLRIPLAPKESHGPVSQYPRSSRHQIRLRPTTETETAAFRRHLVIGHVIGWLCHRVTRWAPFAAVRRRIGHPFGRARSAGIYLHLRACGQWRD